MLICFAHVVFAGRSDEAVYRGCGSQSGNILIGGLEDWIGNDNRQLAPMSKKTKQVLGVDKLEVVADRGYCSSEQIKACADADVTVTLPKPQTSNNKLKGLFVKADFRYVPDHDLYVCPADKLLEFAAHKRDGDMNFRRYTTKDCPTCTLRNHCTTAKQRIMLRWEHEHVLEDVQRRFVQKSPILELDAG